MIWITRALSVALGAIFFVVLLLTLVVWQVGGFFLNPESYASLLDEHDVYEFALADLPTALLEDRRAVEEAKTGDKIEDTPLLASGLTTDRIVAGVNRAVPSDWLQEAVEPNIDELGGYLTGRSDDFTLVIATDERADVLLAELRALLEEADAYGVLYERVLVPRIVEAAAWASERLPFGVEVSDERIAEAARAVLPPEWARSQGQRVFDEATPYLKGDTDELAVNVQLSDRVDVATAEVKDILAESPAYDLVYDKVIAPKIAERLGDTIEGLPFGAAVSSNEVIDALRDAAPPSWVRAQAERLIDEASPYVAGQADAFQVDISLVENKRLTHEILTRLVEKKIQAQIDQLPICRTEEEARSALGGGFGRLPTCVPPNVDPGRILDALGIDLDAEVTRLVLDHIPDSVPFSQAQLRDALADGGAAGNVARLDDVRSLLSDGWTYTEDDLREDLTARGNEAVYDALQDARSILADGWTYTQDDLAEDVIESAGADAMANIDRGRGAIAAVRTYRWLLFLPAALLLLNVGLLGGRDWPGQVVWGAASLIVCAVAVAVLSGLVYPAVASGLIDEARWQAVGDVNPADDYAGTGRLVAGKAFDVIESVSDTLAAGVTTASLVLAVIAAVVVAAVVNRDRIAELVRRARRR